MRVSCSLLYLHHPEKNLTHNWCSVNICWIYEYLLFPRIILLGMSWVPVMCISYPVLTVGLPFLSAPRRPGAPLLLSAWLRAPFPPSFLPWGGCPRALPSTWGKNLAPFPGQARAALLCPRAWSGHTAADATPWRLLARARGPPALFPPPPCLAFRRAQPAAQPLGQVTNQKVRWPKAHPPLEWQPMDRPKDSCGAPRVWTSLWMLGTFSFRWAKCRWSLPPGRGACHL